MKDVIVVIGAGQIGQAIARRVGAGKHVLLADLRSDNANAAAEVLANAGYEVSVATVDASSRDASTSAPLTGSGTRNIRTPRTRRSSASATIRISTGTIMSSTSR